MFEQIVLARTGDEMYHFRLPGRLKQASAKPSRDEFVPLTVDQKQWCVDACDQINGGETVVHKQTYG